MKKLKYTSKSVRDNNQTATIIDDFIEITNRSGRKIISKYKILMTDWLAMDFKIGNMHYHQRELIVSMNQNNITEHSLKERIIDSQVNAILNVMKLLKNN